MYDLSPILGFAVTNSELKRRLRESDYGTVEEHLEALNKYKMWMPEVLQDKQQVHLGLLIAILLDAQNNPSRIQTIKEVVNAKWLMKHPLYSHRSVPKSDNFTKGTIFNIVVGCSRDPYFDGDLLDNPRCAGMFRDDIIERIHHKTMPIYMDKHGNIKLFFEGSTDKCNIFMEDDSLEIPQETLEYLYKSRGIKSAVVSKAGPGGFKKVEVFELSDHIKGEHLYTWLMVGVFALVLVFAIVLYLSYVSNTVKQQHPAVSQPLAARSIVDPNLM